ncbi:tetratricopeptide repeat protein [Tunturiibacter gelidoferens]|uniref:tetratricopeptide repeat protein n=1 Tax=Tunturiibacter gelidiferens TaxID=3069689 RepID=UPI0038730EA0
MPVVGQYERAVEESTEGVRLRPHFALANAFSIRAYTALNRFDEAKATYAQALERKLHTSYIDAAMYSWHSRRTIGRRWSNTLQRCLYRMGAPDVEYGRRYCRLFRAP